MHEFYVDLNKLEYIELTFLKLPSMLTAAKQLQAVNIFHYIWICQYINQYILFNIFQDSEIYTHLLKQIAPLDSGVTLEALMVS